MFPIRNIPPLLPQCQDHEESDDSISSDDEVVDEAHMSFEVLIKDPTLTSQVIPDEPTMSIIEKLSIPESLLRQSTLRARRKCRRYDDFRFEAARLSSFQNWLVPSVDPASLAAAGFYYTGKFDKVKCFVCRVAISHWPEGRTAKQVHQIWSPKCKFVRNEHCDNVPIGTDANEILPVTSRGTITKGRYGLEYSTTEYSRRAEMGNAYELSSFGVKEVKKPVYDRYITYASRLNTFENWPVTHIKAEELVEAGFFYSGTGEKTICYQCGIKIECWRPGIDAWKQHAYSSPSCYYLLVVRGYEYINNVRGQKIYATAVDAPIQLEIGSHVEPPSEDETTETNLVEKFADLKVKNDKLKNARKCIVCTEREANMLFLPCGHLVTCRCCYPAFARCMICEIEIKATTRIYFT